MKLGPAHKYFFYFKPTSNVLVQKNILVETFKYINIIVLKKKV